MNNNRVKIAILGENNPNSASHVATVAAIEHAKRNLGLSIDIVWVSSEDITPSIFETCAGFWIAPGFEPKDPEKMLWAIRYAREHDVPCLGTCGGFQLMVLEYARHVLGISNASHAEYDPEASTPIISPLTCSSFGKEGNVQFVSGSRIGQSYGAKESVETYHCKFGINSRMVSLFKGREMSLSGFDVLGDVRVVEIPTHSFYIGTLFVPQMRSTDMNPHPLVLSFVQAVTEQELI